MSDEEHSDSEETAERNASRRGQHFDEVEASGDIGYEKLVPVVLIFAINYLYNKLLISLDRSIFTLVNNKAQY